MDKLEQFLMRAETLLERVEAMLPPVAPTTRWDAAVAFRWRTRQGRGFLQPVAHPSTIQLSDLQNIDRQKALIEQNTRQFVRCLPANNVLLTGARGTGKSSLIKACLNQFAPEGLRLIEVDKDDLHELGDIVELIAARAERFILFCDDLSFEEGESGYKALKVALDGSIAAQSDNVLIYATSNRRHLLPEFVRDNDTYRHTPDDEIHPGEVVEEKISLSERFGLWALRLYRSGHRRGPWRCIGLGTGARLTVRPRRVAICARLVRTAAEGTMMTETRTRALNTPAQHDAPGSGAATHAAHERRVTERPAGKPYEGYWEFPGGKLEPGESVEDALARELHEELGVTIAGCVRWRMLEHDYPHAYVRLFFCKVTQWGGEPSGREGQAFVWQALPVDVAPLLPATLPVIGWLDDERG
ncbi:hypothetical protein DFQ30_000767 [Apophysomyces sp. BC1015]|nr:hypothetical protein DFQ30_000767 [Apophysomyces sp. BC1015]